MQNKIQTEFGYQIKIKDHLTADWCEWFEGWALNNLENGEVLLTNPSVDQSALHGALNKIRDLNLTLISVIQITAEKALDQDTEKI
jgi:hypothetical protein